MPTHEEIKHQGEVRSGPNRYAKFHLHVEAEGLEPEEEKAVFALWDKQFQLTGKRWGGWWYGLDSRADFAQAPALIRKATRLGYRVYSSYHDLYGKAYLDDEPGAFWQRLALAQAYYEPGDGDVPRFHLYLDAHLGEREKRAVFGLWDEEFGMFGHSCDSYDGGWHYTLSSRREFALAPALIRKALGAGYKVASAHFAAIGQAYLNDDDDDAGVFWQRLALAQAY
jgi:hypothetical protein